eukprot:1190792-Prorocentrum_minimum.AAC.2
MPPLLPCDADRCLGRIRVDTYAYVERVVDFWAVCIVMAASRWATHVYLEVLSKELARALLGQALLHQPADLLVQLHLAKKVQRNQSEMGSKAVRHPLTMCLTNLLVDLVENAAS